MKHLFEWNLIYEEDFSNQSEEAAEECMHSCDLSNLLDCSAIK